MSRIGYPWLPEAFLRYGLKLAFVFGRIIHRGGPTLVRFRLLIVKIGRLTSFLFSANRIPERFSPGMFDYFFSSHQIFHVCVVIAALAHFASISTALDFWHTEQVSCQL